MNCKQLDELLPLYAGRDLDEKRARRVSEHLENCSACARVAGEYREAVELAQHFAPPIFSDNMYASVRRQVMQQLEDEPTAPLASLFGSWFRPRIVWAAASALIIAFGFFALYLVVNRTPDFQPVADKPAEVSHPEQTPDSIAIPGTRPWGAEKRKPAEDKRKGFVNRPLKAVDSSLRTASISPKLREPEAATSLPAVDAAPGKSPLRVEIQTKDPNIRIIWFSQSNSKPALPNSKGI
ncbi:MAG TPA: zf-HC2 domain-containing protein [Pyrinomonadaceae bacterium]|nr:zf-HC2 domain-containing protein [Pyrinomonadaceae bacterium]